MSITPVTNGIYCPVCNGMLYYEYTPNDPLEPYFIACYTCGKVIYRGNNEEEANKFIPNIKKEPARVTKKVTMTMMEAYELNKKREVCIICGNKTKPNFVLTPYIMYCKCVESLSK